MVDSGVSHKNHSGVLRRVTKAAFAEERRGEAIRSCAVKVSIFSSRS